jgi:hypothetical protein
VLDILERRKVFAKRDKKLAQVIQAIRKKYSLRNRVKSFLVDRFSKHWRFQSPELRMIEQQAEERIIHILNVKERATT